MKRIAILMYTMNCGGVESALINLLHRISPKYYKVDLYLVEKEGVFLERIPSYVNVVELRLTVLERELVLQRNMRSVLQKSKFLNFKSKIEALILLLKYIYYRVLGLEFYEFKTVFNCKKNMYPKYDQVWDFHGYNSLTTYLAAFILKSPLKSMWLHSEIVSKLTINYPKTQQAFDNIYAVSKKCADIYNQIYGKGRAQVFYNFIDCDFILKKVANCCSLKQNSKITVLVTVGRLSYPKGYDIALSTAKILKENGFLYKWYFVGDGEEKDKLSDMLLKYKLSDNVVLVGFSDNPYAYMYGCDIYVQTSRYEGYAVTLMEAIILKKVIVTTNVSGSEEAVTDGYNGRIVRPDASELAHAILDIFRGNQYPYMKQNAQSKFLVQSDSEKKLCELLESN